MRRLFSLAVAFVLLVPSARAELVALDVTHREPFAGGKAFGDVGSYEVVRGIARFAIDPKAKCNSVIVDRDLAPRNAAGLVEFAADVYLLAPKNPTKANGAILYDVNNRGKKLALDMFNRGPDGDDGFLMRRGYTIAWSGWIGELLPGENRLLLQAPLARENGQLLRGMVRYEMSADSRVKSMPLSRRDGHGSYPPTKEGEEKGILTKRLHEWDERQSVPRSQWRLIRSPVEKVKDGISGTLPLIRLELDGGFEPGVLYELICEAEGSIVQGVGFAGVRDLVSFLRHDKSTKNPLHKTSITRAHAFGVSQSGRFLRHFLYEGFNEDEQQRIVFEGLMPHVAGGGLGFFNHRFAQPTRHNGQHEDHAYPADVFPFTYGPSLDPFTRKTDSILSHYAKSKTQPKITHTQSAAEYWHRSGCLVHATPDAEKDETLPSNVRLYAFGGTQHGAGQESTRKLTDNPTNPADYRPLLRALLVRLDAWVVEGKEPPASVYPKLEDGTLVDLKQARESFPKIPGVGFPKVIQAPAVADYDSEPPRVRGHRLVYVPKSGDDGNDTGTLLLPDVAVPLATYTGWNLRRKEVGAEGMLASLLGSYLPFAKTKAVRDQSGDSRPSIEERYKDFDSYHTAYAAACSNLVRQGYMIAEDADRLIKGREKVRSLFPEGK